MEPQNRLGVAYLTKLAFEGVDLTPLHTNLLAQCLRQDHPEAALMDLAIIEQLRGAPEIGLSWQEKALSRHRLYRTHAPHKTRRRLLVLAAPGQMGANTPIEFLLQSSEFDIITYYPDVTRRHPPEPLPEHDVIFCAVPCDSPFAAPIRDIANDLAAQTGVTVLNLPQQNHALDRDTLAEMFQHIPGLVVPKTQKRHRDHLKRIAMEELQEGRHPPNNYPFIIRPVGSHAGKGLAKIDTAQALLAYLSAQEADAFHISEFIDYASSSDGLYRKYRVVFIDGEAFPCHMAIGGRWDLWYMNAEMSKSGAKRREEAAFMDQFADNFARRHRHHFSALTSGIDLSYFGIDCAEDRDGNLVVFEADNALIVHDMDSKAVFPYKGPHMRRIFDGFENLLLRHCHPDDDLGTPRWPIPAHCQPAHRPHLPS